MGEERCVGQGGAVRGRYEGEIWGEGERREREVEIEEMCERERLGHNTVNWGGKWGEVGSLGRVRG